MTAADFGFAVLALAGVAIAWTILVCLLLNVTVTTPVPQALTRAVQAGRTFFGAPTADCPRCGRPGEYMGETDANRWWYCDTCGQPWLVDKRTDPTEAVA